MELGYFFCGDLLGFKNIIKNLNPNDVDNKVNEWVSLVKESAETNKINKFQLISDTVFAGVGKEKSDLKNLIDFARELLNKGISKSLPVRGAISYGSYHWGNLVYGDAVIKAHNLEKRQNWIGVTIDEVNTGILHNEDYADMEIVCYPCPMFREDYIKLYRVISWSIPKFEELSIKLTGGGLTVKGECLKWDWGDKIGNTVLFGLYIKALEENNQSPHEFRGLHPVHFIDEIFRPKL